MPPEPTVQVTTLFDPSRQRVDPDPPLRPDKVTDDPTATVLNEAVPETKRFDPTERLLENDPEPIISRATVGLVVPTPTRFVEAFTNNVEVSTAKLVPSYVRPVFDDKLELDVKYGT